MLLSPKDFTLWALHDHIMITSLLNGSNRSHTSALIAKKMQKNASLVVGLWCYGVFGCQLCYLAEPNLGAP